MVYLIAMAQESFETEIHVRFGDADPAGIMYFPKVFEFAHEAFEDFVDVCGIGWKNWFRAGPYIVPIRQVSAEFLRPFFPGRKYRVRGRVSKLGASSFEMSYEFQSFEAEPVAHARVQMVHVFADSATKMKMPIPAEIRSKMKRFHVLDVRSK